MKAAIVVLFGLLGLAGSASAQTPVAVVEEVQGKVTGAEFMDYVVPGKTIKLGPDGSRRAQLHEVLPARDHHRRRHRDRRHRREHGPSRRGRCEQNPLRFRPGAMSTVSGRIEGSVTTISWIPSEAVEGAVKAGFKLGFTHYDTAPPDEIGPDIDVSLGELVATDRFRFANHLRAWAQFDEAGHVVASGHLGGGHLGATNVRIGTDVSLAATGMPERRGEPEIGPGWIRFTQTNGGRTGLPLPRAVRHAPFVQFKSPVAWSTLELTLFADGRRRGPPRRRLTVPAPLDLRHRREARRQERQHRLEGLGWHGVRQAHAVGRRGLAGVRDGGRVGARA